jgi:probable rRNA maturation factor
MQPKPNTASHDLLKKYSDIQISVKLSRGEEIKKLNKEYLDRDFTTDVLSFNMNEDMGNGAYYLGDLIVNVDQAEAQAKEYDNTVEQEIAELVEHGVLHLLGVHHDDDDEKSVHGVKV